MSEQLTPNFEVKCLLKTQEVLTTDGRLNDQVRSAFKVASIPKKMSIQFVDTKNKDIYNNGWNLRIRKTEGKSKFELTYKKRYPVVSGIDIGVSDVRGNIVAALEIAMKDEFDLSSKFNAQIEVGYQQQTLSISNDQKVPDTGFRGLDLPLEADARGMLIAQAPQQFKKWSAGLDNLSKAVVYGPVHATRYEGKLGDLDIDIEVWPIRKSNSDPSLELIAETSFKADELQSALKGKADLGEFLSDRGWLSPEDSLKTKLIMERYGQTA